MIKMVYQTRLENLQRLLDKHEGGAAVAKKIGTTKQYMSLICPLNSPPKRAIGDKMARRIESAFGLPIGFMDTKEEPAPQDEDWVDVPCLSPTIALGAPEVTQTPQSVQSMRLSKAFVRQQTAASSLDHLAVFTMPDDTMDPTCAPGSILLIDAAATTAVTSGVYILGHGGQLSVKRVQRHVDGAFEIICDNAAYSPRVLPSLKGIVVFGRVLLSMSVNKL